jgi:hypothetical protein
MVQLARALLDHQSSPQTLNDLCNQVLDENGVRQLSALLQPPHVRALQRWPREGGGGIHGVMDVLVAVSTILRSPLPQQSFEFPKATLIRWQHAMYNEGVIMGALSTLRFVAKRHNSSYHSPYAAIDLLSRLVLLSSNFLNQFMSLRGLATLRDNDAFSETAPVKIIVNSLLIASQVLHFGYYMHINTILSLLDA